MCNISDVQKHANSVIQMKNMKKKMQKIVEKSIYPIYDRVSLIDFHIFHQLFSSAEIGEENVQKLEELKMVDDVIELMRQVTASSAAEKKPRRFSKKPGNFSAEVTNSQDDCVDKSSDCERNRKLCTHKAYTSLFQKICAKTCEYCGLADSTTDLESSGELF